MVCNPSVEKGRKPPLGYHDLGQDLVGHVPNLDVGGQDFARQVAEGADQRRYRVQEDDLCGHGLSLELV